MDQGVKGCAVVGAKGTCAIVSLFFVTGQTLTVRPVGVDSHYTLVLGYVPFPCGVFVLVTTMAIGVHCEPRVIILGVSRVETAG